MRITAFESNVHTKRLNHSRKYSSNLEETVSDQRFLLFFGKPKMLTVLPLPLDKNLALSGNSKKTPDWTNNQQPSLTINNNSLTQR